MTKLSKKDLAVLVVCGVFWLGSIVAMCYIKHWAVIFVALLHCMTIWIVFTIGGKYIPTKPPKTQLESERELAAKQAEDAIRKENMDELIIWDIIDDD